MKRNYLFYGWMLLAAAVGLTACHDDETQEFHDTGSCRIVSFNGPETAYMGDSIEFSFQVESEDIRLNQTKIQLYYGEDIVSERFVLTPENGEYTGKLLIPFVQNMADGDVALKLRVQNERFANAVAEKTITVSRPQFEKLVLTDAEGNTYDMLPTGEPYEYSVTGFFPSELFATIEAPKYGANGNDIVFGSSDGKITNGTATAINFTSDIDGVYTVTFNTLTFEGTPFIKFALNDVEFELVDEMHSRVDMELKQGQDIKITGLKSDYANYWVNPAFFRKVKGTDGKTLRFMGRDGMYRVTVDKSLKYFRVEVLKDDGSDIGTLPGQDVIWCNGNGDIGQPSYSKNGINWSTGDKVICLAPIGGGKHQLVLEPGATINKNSINFKFFYQKGWGGEFTADKISIADGSSWFRVDTQESGNIKGGSTPLQDGKFYVVTVDISEGESSAKMSVEEVDGFDEAEPLPAEDEEEEAAE